MNRLLRISLLAYTASLGASEASVSNIDTSLPDSHTLPGCIQTEIHAAIEALDPVVKNDVLAFEHYVQQAHLPKVKPNCRWQQLFAVLFTMRADLSIKTGDDLRAYQRAWDAYIAYHNIEMAVLKKRDPLFEM